MNYRPGGPVPLHMPGPWKDTLVRWHAEGLPEGVAPNDLLAPDRLRVHNYGYAFGLFPAFETKVLHETEEFIVSTDRAGRTIKDFKHSTSMPEWLSVPVNSPEDLRRIIDERFDPARLAERFSEKTDAALRNAVAENQVLMLNGGGFYWVLRELAGVDGASYLFYDAPELVEELFDKIELQIAEGMRRMFAIATPDVIGYGEDIAFKTGPLISPDMFRRHILPRYKRLLELARANGVTQCWYDSDGDLSLLLPDMLSIGINGVAPCEVAANMQPNRLRKMFGRELRLIGGIDKREVAAGRNAIDQELERLRPVVEEGGFLPAIDHSVSSDISWADYQYFVERLRKRLEG